MRSPSQVMRLARMGSFHQSRISFLRTLMRRINREQWQFERPVWTVDPKGVGVGVYTATGPDRTYSLIAYAHDLDPSKRSDRVIAEQWDATFTLFDGVPTQEDIDRLAPQVEKQEAGRISGKELTLSRANRSVRLFEYVRDCLAQGKQPEQKELDSVGYLMRTTAVYGSGKFGALDRRFIANRPEFTAPFQVELLTVYLIRWFTIDIVEHMALSAAPQKAVKLNPDLRRRLGVGNSTGLGMAPFIVNHPALLHHWINARETALATVRAVPCATEKTQAEFVEVLARQRLGLEYWHTEHEDYAQRIEKLTTDLSAFTEHLSTFDWSAEQPFDRLYRWGEANLSIEAQECLVSLIIEPFGDLIDDLDQSMSVDEEASFHVNGRMKIAELREILATHYQFVSEIDFDLQEANARFWYASEEKLEPRLGERFEESGADREHPLASARDIAHLIELSEQFDKSSMVAELLIRFPECRHAVRRVQIGATHAYAEIHDNLIGAGMVPLDLLRCKLSFFGANRFDPRSDRWIRITLFQHAPFPDELRSVNTGDDWIYPALAS